MIESGLLSTKIFQSKATLKIGHKKYLTLILKIKDLNRENITGSFYET